MNNLTWSPIISHLLCMFEDGKWNFYRPYVEPDFGAWARTKQEFNVPVSGNFLDTFVPPSVAFR